MKGVILLFFLAVCSFAGGAERSLEEMRRDLEEDRKKAEAGDARYQFVMGVSYEHGPLLNPVAVKDESEAAKWYLRAAEQGLAGAQYSLGRLYSEGRGVTKDEVEAVKWYTKAAEQGVAEAQFVLGLMYARGSGVLKDEVEAAKWFRRAAEQGFANAQHLLGLSYFGGNGVPRDEVEAVKWYRMAAEQGFADAQYLLGVNYAVGRGVEKNENEAVKWYGMAAVRGVVDAQFLLGGMYDLGRGVLRDEVEALAWFGVAAFSGDKDAAKGRDRLEKALDRQSVLRARERSKEILAEIEKNKVRSAEGAVGQGQRDKKHVADPAPRGSGSGTIVSSDGHVLTAFHVIEGATRIAVFTQGGMKEATLLQSDPQNDLAVLKIGGGGIACLRVGRSRGIRLGQAVSTIGFPNIGIQGFSPKVTKGEISSINGASDDPRSWQISVPVQPGNSGGPLLDENGHLIGVVVSKLGLKAAKAIGDIPQNVNYAVKISYALPLLEQFLSEESLNQKTETKKLSFEDMISNAQKSVVLILVY